MLIHKLKNKEVIVITDDDTNYTIIPFSHYDTLPDEYVLIKEDAYGDRSVGIYTKRDINAIFEEDVISLF